MWEVINTVDKAPKRFYNYKKSLNALICINEFLNCKCVSKT